MKRTPAMRRLVRAHLALEYQIEVFPTLLAITPGDRLRLTLSSADTPHLTPLPGQLAQLTGGVYNVQRSAAAPSSLTLPLIP